VLTNGQYCAYVSQTGGGFSFVDDSMYNRITRSIPGDNTIEDRPGRYLYIRDNDTGEYWSATWQPIKKTPTYYQARHGIGYTSIASSYKEIDSSVTYFVPMDDPCEIWQAKLVNFGDKKRNLSVFAFVEWDLGIHHDNTVEASFNDLFNYTEFKNNTIYATKRHWRTINKSGLYWDKVAFMTSDHAMDSFDASKEKFYGMYGSISNPQAVIDGKCSRSEGEGHRAIGVLQKNITLAPKKDICINYIVGVGYMNPESKNFDQTVRSGIGHAQKIIKKYTQPKAVDQALIDVREHWHQYIEKTFVNSPDDLFDYSFNYWNKYQAWYTATWSLMSSYYIGGGSTIGFRDMSQHIIGVMPNDIEMATKKLKELISFQLKDGRVVHNWDNYTKKGTITEHSDDPQWLILSAIFYLKETGDLKFLKEEIKFYDGGEATVLEHLTRAMAYSLKKLSHRNLPYRMTADWNDALNGEKLGKGESEMVACQITYNLKELIPILEEVGDHYLVNKYRQAYAKLKEAVNKYFWDGEWYLRGTTPGHHSIGSKNNKYNKIEMNAQSWAVMSGVADKKRAIKAMDSVWKRLNTEYGPAIFLPSYQHPDEEYGVISQFTPGTKENGAIFNHPVTWAIIAETMLGRGDRAYEYWKETSFAYRGQDPANYRVEPYVYAEFVYGPEHPEFGRGSFTWATGSASWFWRASLDYILGVQPVIGGLKVDPCIPKDWRQVRVSRRFRGADYHFQILNPVRVSKGVSRILVDGVRLVGSVIPPFSSGTHYVEVTLG